jgi:hypothetical protein
MSTKAIISIVFLLSKFNYDDFIYLFIQDN